MTQRGPEGQEQAAWGSWEGAGKRLGSSSGVQGKDPAKTDIHCPVQWSFLKI